MNNKKRKSKGTKSDKKIDQLRKEVLGLFEKHPNGSFSTKKLIKSLSIKQKHLKHNLDGILLDLIRKEDIEVTDIEVADTYLRVESKGISQPFHYSLDGSDFDNDSGELALDSSDEFDLYITNAYDTVIYENLRIQEITKLEMQEPDYSILSPNPSKGLYEINQGGFVQVFSSSGKIVYECRNEFDHHVIDIRNKRNGLYIIRVIQDSQVTFYKVLKE